MEKLTNSIISGLYSIKNESPEYTDLIRLTVKALKRVCELDVALRNVQNSVRTISHKQIEWIKKSMLTAYHERLVSREQRESTDNSEIDAYKTSQSENDSEVIFRSDCYWYYN